MAQFDSAITQIDLINMALSYINQATISTLEEKSVPAKLMKLHWPLSVRSLLYKANWSFALDRAVLNRVSGMEEEYNGEIGGEDEDDEDDEDFIKRFPEHPYCFALPSDLVRITGVYKESGRQILSSRKGLYQNFGSAPETVTEYKIWSNYVWSKNDVLVMEYVRNVTNINEFPPSFMNCICYDLALRGAKILIDSASYVEQMRQALQQELMFAMNLDAGQQLGEFAY